FLFRVSEAPIDLFFVAFMTLFVVQFVMSITKKSYRYSHRVAVLGLPRSGKTTMITVLFDRIISSTIAKKVSVQGNETVNRITQNLHRLQNGEHLQPTTDNGVFAYRFGFEKYGFPIKKLFDVEVADFPGEYSADFATYQDMSEDFHGLFKKEFFSWIVRADRYIFTIDTISCVINGDKSRNAHEILIKNSVLNLKQELLDNGLENKKAILVFTKCDALLADKSVFSEESHEGTNESFFYGSGEIEELSTNAENIRRLAQRHDELRLKFESTIQFLRHNFDDVQVVFHSSYMDTPPTESASERIIAFMLP
ncbi:MAG: GTPase domain-containing protein, partial [Pseudomonadota bacterium]